MWRWKIPLLLEMLKSCLIILLYPFPHFLFFLNWFDSCVCMSDLSFLLILFLSFTSPSWLAHRGPSYSEISPPPLPFLSEGWRDKWRWKQEIRNTWFMMYLCQAVRRGLSSPTPSHVCIMKSNSSTRTRWLCQKASGLADYGVLNIDRCFTCVKIPSYL